MTPELFIICKIVFKVIIGLVIIRPIMSLFKVKLTDKRKEEIKLLSRGE